MFDLHNEVVQDRTEPHSQLFAQLPQHLFTFLLIPASQIDCDFPFPQTPSSSIRNPTSQFKLHLQPPWNPQPLKACPCMQFPPPNASSQVRSTFKLKISLRLKPLSRKTSTKKPKNGSPTSTMLSKAQIMLPSQISSCQMLSGAIIFALLGIFIRLKARRRSKNF